jgi:toxin ParE1/3/4
MTQVELAPEIQNDFDRILDHLIEHDVGDAAERVIEIIEAVDVLHHNPRIGRRVAEDLRELVIGRSSRGYVALYRYVEAMDTVFVLAIRSQREAGYAGT